MRNKTGRGPENLAVRRCMALNLVRKESSKGVASEEASPGRLERQLPDKGAG